MKANTMSILFTIMLLPIFSIAHKGPSNLPDPSQTGPPNMLYFGSVLLFTLALVALSIYCYRQLAAVKFELTRMRNKLVSHERLCDTLMKRQDELTASISSLDERQIGIRSKLEYLTRNKAEPAAAQQIEVAPTVELRHQDEIVYANYRIQDGCFGAFDKHNEGYYLWKITVVSNDDAFYELADIDVSHYANRWNDINRIAKFSHRPTGYIVAGRNIERGRVKRVGNEWIVDEGHLAEVEFDYK